MPGQSVDVAVVGCGVIAAAVAWRLARDGASVRCLDPSPGDGATHAAAGMLGAVAEADFGEHDLTAMNVESARRWPAFAAELEAASGRSTGIRSDGTLTLAYDSGDRQQLQRLLQLRRRWGLDVTEITVDEARRTEPLLGPRLAGALWAPGDHQVDARRVHDALLRVLDANGVSVLRRRVARLDRAPGGSVTGVIDDAGERHVAGSVVLAAGCGSRALTRDLPELDVPVRPVKGQVLRLDADADPTVSLEHVVRGYVQARPVYLVPRSGEIVVGATSEEQPDDGLVTAGGVFAVLRDARALVPGIDELPVRDLTARARPATPDNLPMIGPSGVDGLVLATGHYRNGILLTPLTAAAIAAHLDGSGVPPVLAPADPSRFAPVTPAPSGG
ncbi:glycine oxidase [Haloactinopolyspora alba]|uniref:glycine oxidase n=1 Tax=Haloactinopolyspora alba TaxID=648780 RepID=A0A2P8EFX7_9ACTN|nr:glycine oxidase ThiO [Haloactinopolyspora alba]PSL08376.1 glycine oxidase [Haloactinopolyspora alba]